MLFNEILQPTSILDVIRREIRDNCSQFLNETNATPVYRLLPTTYGPFKRVKVRFQKKKDAISNVFENAFGTDGTLVGVRERAVIVSAEQPAAFDNTIEPYYIFPVDGYQYMFSTRVKNSTDDFEYVVNTLIHQFDINEGTILASDLIKYSYKNTNLSEGLYSKSEIIFHNIPCFYAVQASLIQQYKTIIS